MIKVLVVDDQALVRKGIMSLLEGVKDIEVIGEASSGEEAIAVAHKQLPDVVLMDIQMPGMGGLEATRKLLRFDADIKVLVLTVYDNEVYPARFLEEGASGYLTKDAGVEELLSAIRALSKGKRYISNEIAQQLALKRFGPNDESSPFACLSERELQVVMMIIQGKRAPAIAELLHLSPKTINTYRYRIFEKLRLKSDVELTHLALRYGLIQGD